MKKIIPPILALFLMMGCKKDAQVQNTATGSKDEKTNVIKIKNGLEFQTFSFPQDIQGCSCYFARNKADFDAEKYIYADDYGSNAQVRISGQLVKFPMKEGDFDPSNFNKNLDNGEYRLEISGKKINDSDEEMIFVGKITVTDKNDNTATETLYGECGC